jgi:hypothetical protein
MKMKSFPIMMVATMTGLALSGCAAGIYPGGPTVAGGLITSVRSPAQKLAVAIDPQAKCLKEGRSSAGSFLGLFAFGDGGIGAAMKNGGITKINHADHEVSSFLLGVWESDTLIVCGE